MGHKTRWDTDFGLLPQKFWLKYAPANYDDVCYNISLKLWAKDSVRKNVCPLVRESDAMTNKCEKLRRSPCLVSNPAQLSLAHG